MHLRIKSALSPSSWGNEDSSAADAENFQLEQWNCHGICVSCIVSFCLKGAGRVATCAVRVTEMGISAFTWCSNDHNVHVSIFSINPFIIFLVNASDAKLFPVAGENRVHLKTINLVWSDNVQCTKDINFLFLTGRLNFKVSFV